MGETVTTALTTAFTQIKTDVLDGVATALPYALAIGGCIIAIRICWSFFKSAARKALFRHQKARLSAALWFPNG